MLSGSRALRPVDVRWNCPVVALSLSSTSEAEKPLGGVEALGSTFGGGGGGGGPFGGSLLGPILMSSAVDVIRAEMGDDARVLRVVRAEHVSIHIDVPVVARQGLPFSRSQLWEKVS